MSTLGMMGGICAWLSWLFRCRKTRPLSARRIQNLWIEWAIKAVARDKRLTARRDFSLAGQICKVNKRRWREKIKKSVVEYSVSEDE